MKNGGWVGQHLRCVFIKGGRDGEKDDIAFFKPCPFNISWVRLRLWETINAWHTFTDADTTSCLGGMDISL